MSAIESDAFRSPVVDGDDSLYRSVSKSAVFSIVLGVLGLLAYFGPILLILPFLGLIFAFLSLYAFSRYPDELSGKYLAFAGLFLNGMICVFGPIYHSYIYATEVPDGYVRIGFSELKSPFALSYPEAPPPDDALKLDGKRVFLKGYVHPNSVTSTESKTFVLVPDFSTCCFGGQPALTDMVEVDLSGDLTVRASTRKIRLAGVLTVDKNLKPVSGLNGVYYQLRADYLK